MTRSIVEMSNLICVFIHVLDLVRVTSFERRLLFLYVLDLTFERRVASKNYFFFQIKKKRLRVCGKDDDMIRGEIENKK